MRLDLYLVQKGISDSRTRAKNLIELRKVTVNGKVAEKASLEIKETDEVILSDDYEASLGGIKLRDALERFSVAVEKVDCLDIGASNGGFCDILLRGGASHVIALDVGECALPDRLKNDARIVVMDRTNARFLTPDQLPFLPGFISVDVSFISLLLILPVVYSCLVTGGKALCLIKPQFECGKKALSKKGIVTDKKEEERAIERIKECARNLGFSVGDIMPAPHPFEKKNQEYFIFLQK